MKDNNNQRDEIYSDRSISRSDDGGKMCFNKGHGRERYSVTSCQSPSLAEDLNNRYRHMDHMSQSRSISHERPSANHLVRKRKNYHQSCSYSSKSSVSRNSDVFDNKHHFQSYKKLPQNPKKNVSAPQKVNKFLSGLSVRQQVKFLMEKTKQEANWDMDKDSDIKNGSESSQDENGVIKNYYENKQMWQSSFIKSGTAKEKEFGEDLAPGIVPFIRGIGGSWGQGTRDEFEKEHEQLLLKVQNSKTSDFVEPFFIQYEKRMEFLRRKMVNQQKYRLRMFAYATLQFNPIKQNKFLDRKKNIFTDSHAQYLICSCQKAKKLSKMQDAEPEKSQRNKWGSSFQLQEQNQPSINCGKRCLNRDMSFECSALSCPSVLYCTNRHFQTFQDRLVYPIKTQFKGWGVAAGEFIPKNSFVMQYVGEVFNVDSDVGQKRIQRYKNSTCTYLMRIENNEVIDPTYSGNIARFINHSCDPNCQTRKWTVLNEVCVGIFTLKDIQENEELTFDYQFDFFKTPCTKCYCGTAKCKGYLGVATNLSDDSDSVCSDDSQVSEERSHQSGKSSDSKHEREMSLDSAKSQNKSKSNRSASEEDNMDDLSDDKVSECERIRLQREQQILDSEVNQQKPTCFICAKEILDTKRILICKGPCKQIFHYDCALKQDKNLKNVPKLLQKRKFECKPCMRKASGQKKRGRKSHKEMMELMHQENNEPGKAPETTSPVAPTDPGVQLPVGLEQQHEAFHDVEFQRIYTNSAVNLLLDRVIMVQLRKADKHLAKLTRDRLLNYNKSHKSFMSHRHKKFQQQQFSDHYSFMFELIRRLKIKLRKIVDPTQTDGPAGCSIVMAKFFKEFPRIAKCQEDVDRIEREGLDNQFMVDNQDQDDEEEQEYYEEQPPESRKKASKRKNRKMRMDGGELIITNNTNDTKKRRGRPPKQRNAQAENQQSTDPIPTQEQNEAVGPENANISDAVPESESEIDELQQEDAEMRLEDEQNQEEEEEDENEDEDSSEREELDEYEDDSSEKDELMSQNENDEDIFASEQDDEEQQSNEDDQDEEEDDDEEQENPNELDHVSDPEEKQSDQGPKDAEMSSSDQIRSPSVKSNQSQKSEKPATIEPKKKTVKPQKREKPAKKEPRQPNTTRVRGRPRKQVAVSPKKLQQQNKSTTKLFKVSSAKESEEQPQKVVRQENSKEQLILKKYDELKAEIDQKWQAFIERDIEESQAQTQPQTKPSRFNITERVFNMVIKNHVDDLDCFSILQVFWEKPWGSNVILKIISTKVQYQNISSLLQFCTDRLFQIHNEHRIDENLSRFEIMKIPVPKNLIRKLVGYKEKSLQYFRLNPRYNVDFYYDEKLLVDEIFNMNECADLKIFGKKSDVIKVTNILLHRLEQIKMKSILIQKVDCNFVMNNVKEIKSQVDPCEVRIKQNERIWKDLRHPFLYLPNYLRDIILIGTQEEIKIAEKKLQAFTKQKRERENYQVSQQLSFLLPIFMKDCIERIKSDVRFKFQTVQVFHYLPTFPRKHLTISMIGPWTQVLEAKRYLEHTCQPSITQSYRSFDHFQQTVFHQQIRFAFKSLKRYILEKDIKYLSHWDIVSVFVDNIGKEIKPQVDEEYVDRIVKERQRQQQQEALLPAPVESPLIPDKQALGTKLPPVESNLDKILGSDEVENQPYDMAGLQLQIAKKSHSMTVNRAPSMSDKRQTVDATLTLREKVTKEYLDKMMDMKRNEIQLLIKYIKEEDPETCINILFVLSQCQTEEESKNNKKDQLNSMMDRLQINRHFLLTCMHTVLLENLTEFFISLGKSKHHIKMFESSSESEAAVSDDPQYFRVPSNRAGRGEQREMSQRQKHHHHSSRRAHYRAKSRERYTSSASHHRKQAIPHQQYHHHRDQMYQRKHYYYRRSSSRHRANEIQFKDDEDCVIKDNQQIPRFGFSRSIKDEDSDLENRTLGEKRPRKPQTIPQEFGYKRQRIDRSSSRNQEEFHRNYQMDQPQQMQQYYGYIPGVQGQGDMRNQQQHFDQTEEQYEREHMQYYQSRRMMDTRMRASASGAGPQIPQYPLREPMEMQEQQMHRQPPRMMSYRDQPEQYQQQSQQYQDQQNRYLYDYQRPPSSDSVGMHLMLESRHSHSRHRSGYPSQRRRDGASPQQQSNQQYAYRNDSLYKKTHSNPL